MEAPIDEAVSHPVTLWVAVGVGAVVAAALGVRRVAQVLAPGWAWWHRREVRELQRQAEIEAAAALLNDQRVGILLQRIEGLTIEIAAQRAESERRADLYELEIKAVRDQLSEALVKISALEVEL